MTRHSRRSLARIAVLMFVGTVAACSPSGGLGQVPSRAPTPAPSVEQGSPDVTAGPSTGPGPSGDPTPSASANPSGGETTVVRSYFYLGGEPGSAGLVPVLREVPRTPAIGTAAMGALLAGPTGAESAERAITSAVPDGSRLF